MLGRKDYSQEEIDHAAATVRAQLAAFASLGAAKGSLEHVYFNNMTLALDRLFVHRIRPVTGKGTNPLNELELIAQSLIDNGGVFAPGKVIKYVPAASVLQLQAGDTIELTAAQYERLATACLADVQAKFRP